MNLRDRDLVSIQKVRDLIDAAEKAQVVYRRYDQKKVDEVCQAIADAGVANSKKLAIHANAETGFGNVDDKIIKNIFASKMVNDRYKGTKTIDVINEDYKNRVIDIAEPVGVVAGLIPSTNPTSSVFYKAIISLKSGNAIIFSPHPKAKKCILEAVDIIRKTLSKIGAPVDLVSSMDELTIAATTELMSNKGTKLILATGGAKMVRAAYSSGTPALGVGPGNGPAFIEKSANVKRAVQRIVDSKTFDNGTICASEQSVLVDQVISPLVKKAFQNAGGYFLNTEEALKVSKYIMRDNGTMNPLIVGKTAQKIAKLAQIDIPVGTKLLIAEDNLNNISTKNPYSREKLAPILTFYVAQGTTEAIKTANRLLRVEGAGHTAMIHSENKRIIAKYGENILASRILVNSPGSLGGIGATVNLNPALTLGCGAIGGSSTSDNVSPLNLINIRREAFGVRDLDDIKADLRESGTSSNAAVSEELIEAIVKQVLSEVRH